MIQSEINERILAGEKLWAILIDPDKLPYNEITDFMLMANSSTCDYILVGGSLINHGKFNMYLKKIHEISTKSILLFPGNNQQISPHADAILLLTLISGRNPDLLIGQHVKTAFQLKESGLEILPCGYLLIESNQLTSAIYMSESLPIPKNKPDIAAATALAGTQLGLQYIYLDTGSGSQNKVNEKIILEVKKNIDVPLIVGGGIIYQDQLINTWNAGADLVIIGTSIEKKYSNMFDFKKQKEWN